MSPQTTLFETHSASSPRPARQHAGASRGPGRPKKPLHERGASHARRPAVSPRHPRHITVRFRRDTWNLRSQRCFSLLLAALARVRNRSNFRVVHFSVQGNHVHLLAEAHDRSALSRGMRALLISIARRLNALMGASGSRFEDRYHEHPLTTPSQVYNALRYVLCNRAHHQRRATVEGRGLRCADPFASARWDGSAPAPDPRFEAHLSGSRSWLLREGYLRGAARPRAREGARVAMAGGPGASGGWTGSRPCEPKGRIRRRDSST